MKFSLPLPTFYARLVGGKHRRFYFIKEIQKYLHLQINIHIYIYKYAFCGCPTDQRTKYFIQQMNIGIENLQTFILNIRLKIRLKIELSIYHATYRIIPCLACRTHIPPYPYYFSKIMEREGYFSISYPAGPYPNPFPIPVDQTLP